MSREAMVDLEAIRRAVEAATTASAERLPDVLLALDQARGILEAATRALVMKAVVIAARPARIQEPDTLLTVAEVAARVGLCADTVRSRRAELGGSKIGSSLRFSRRAVEAYIQRRAAGERC